MDKFQNQVYSKQALGSAGDIVKGLHSYFTAFQYPAKDNSVCVGCFVQLDGDFVKGASGNAITGKILGVAIKEHFIGGDAPTAIYRPNDIVSVMVKGCIFIETEAVAKVGQYVFLKTDNGTLAFDDTKEKADHTYTGFRVAIGTGATLAGDSEIIAVITE